MNLPLQDGWELLEGGFTCRRDADNYAIAEVGVPHRIEPEGNGRWRIVTPCPTDEQQTQLDELAAKIKESMHEYIGRSLVTRSTLDQIKEALVTRARQMLDSYPEGDLFDVTVDPEQHDRIIISPKNDTAADLLLRSGLPVTYRLDGYIKGSKP